jgi:hypothetical protein
VIQQQHRLNTHRVFAKTLQTRPPCRRSGACDS